MGAGSEERNLLADDAQSWAKAFFVDKLKWEFIVEKFDISKTRGRPKRGLDMILQCFDPFLHKTTNIIVECKFRAETKFLTLKTLSEMIDSLKAKVELAPSSNSFSGTLIEKLIDKGEKWVGLLFLKLRDFDHEALTDTLNSVEMVGSKNNPTLITVLFNYRVSKLVEFLRNKQEVEYWYPVHGQNKEGTWYNYLSYSYLFSDIIVGRYKEGNGKIGFLISFEGPSESSVSYLLSVIKNWYIFGRNF